MKRIIILLVALALLLAMAGCGNVSFGMGNFSYKKGPCGHAQLLRMSDSEELARQ